MAKTYMGGGAGGGGSYTAGTGIDITGNVISATAGDCTCIKTVKVSLSSAQILDSNTTLIELIAAPGAGKIIDIINIIQKNTYIANEYETNTDSIVFYGTALADVYLLDLAFSSSGFFAIAKANVSNSFDFENQPITFFTKAGNPTAGDGTIDLYISFQVISL